MRIVKLSEVLKHRKEFIQISDDQSYKLCRVQTNRKGVLLREIKIGALIQTKKQQVCKKGDFIVAEMDAKVGGYGFIPEDLDGSIVSSHYFLFDVDFGKIRKEYLEAIIQTEIIQEQIKAKGSTNYSAIRPKDVLNWEIPLATLDEQKEIEKNFLKIREVSINLLVEIECQKTLLSQLKQSILQEAIQGKLTEEWRVLRQSQQAPLEPASELLKRIQAEKAKLIKEKKIKKEKPLPPITDSEKPFELPEGWEWCRFQTISINRDELRKPISKRERESKNKLYDYYGASGVIDKIDGFTHDGKFLLIGEDGSNLRLRSTPVAFEASGKFWVNNHAHSVQFIEEITQKFIRDFINGIDLTPFITGGFQPKLSQGNLNLIPVPFPPLEEQQAIVGKVESLMEKCRALEEEINQSEQHAQMLMQAVMKEAFER
ncbi:restriction endonuclease subunit S [Shivajiella indica]|uniref:Restriction endonuclease subunit S n=1 Tax=Shivajiella indica TaxID=872115 RepID=A0ABW5B475_9BACT